MASKTSITSEKILEIVKNKWQVFGISAFLIFILQLLSSKVLISVFLGLIITALLPSESLTKVLKKSFQLDPKTTNLPSQVHSMPTNFLELYLRLKKTKKLPTNFLDRLPNLNNSDLHSEPLL